MKKKFFIILLAALLLLGCAGAPNEPLPETSVSFADENEANKAMMRFYDENRELLTTVANDMRTFGYAKIEKGVVYPYDGKTVDFQHPCTTVTDAVDAFLQLPDGKDYVLWWDDQPLFSVCVRWTNDSGYYSTNLVFAEDGQRIVKMMYEKQGITLEPVYEDSAWGVYTIRWQQPGS